MEYLPAALAAAQAGRKLIVPAGNGAEAALAREVEATTARTLLEVCGALTGSKTLPQAIALPLQHSCGPDLSDVRGQAHARRALEIAAAGNHHLLLVGPPGCGKTLLASRLPGLLPEASEAEALEAAAIASVSGRGLDPARWLQRPYRSPHHTASAVALVGGGAEPRPGEISLAHNGVLFLDELPEWSRQALEVLRQPLESGVVTISRAARQSEFPARFQLVAAMNPCPCGWAGDASGRCRCGNDSIQRYRARISGPLLDRIDLHVDVPRLPPAALRADAPQSESSAEVRARVEAARRSSTRVPASPTRSSTQSETVATCRLTDARRATARTRDRHAATVGAFAAPHPARRPHHCRSRRLRADRTAHLTEAIGYRRLDRGIPVPREPTPLALAAGSATPTLTALPPKGIITPCRPPSNAHAPCSSVVPALSIFALTALAIGVAAVPATAAEPAAAQVELIAREALFGNPERANVQISPDGKTLSWVAPVDGVLNLWVAPADHPAQASAVTDDKARGIRQYFWSYRPGTLLYLRDTGGDEDFHLYALDLASGTTRDLRPFPKTRAQVNGVSHLHPESVLVGDERSRSQMARPVSRRSRHRQPARWSRRTTTRSPDT